MVEGGERPADGAAHPLVVDLERGEQAAAPRALCGWVGKIYNGQSGLLAYMIAISTTYFYELKWVYIAVTDTFAITKPIPPVCSFPISGFSSRATSSLLCLRATCAVTRKPLIYLVQCLNRGNMVDLIKP